MAEERANAFVVGGGENWKLNGSVDAVIATWGGWSGCKSQLRGKHSITIKRLLAKEQTALALCRTRDRVRGSYFHGALPSLDSFGDRSRTGGTGIGQGAGDRALGAAAGAGNADSFSVLTGELRRARDS